MRGYRSTMLAGFAALTLAAGCSDDEAGAGAADQGAAADARAMADAGQAADMQAPDGAAPDAALMPPAETVTLTLANLADVDGVGGLGGVSACVLEYPEALPCAAVEGEPGDAVITVPKGEPFHVTLNGPDYEPMVIPFEALEADHNVGGWPIVRRGTAAVAAGLLNVATDGTRGFVAVQVSGTSTDPLALEGTGFELVGADAPAYFGEANGLPNPDRMDVAGGGRVFFVNLEPGQVRLRVTPPEGACASPQRTGWPVAGEANTVDLQIVAGHITALSVECDAPGRDVQACDYVAQDCGAGQKCRYIGFESSGGRSGWGTECVPDGDRPLDADCERDGAVGADNCQAGTVCVNFSRPAGTGRVCRAACLGDSDCPDALQCYGLRVSGAGNPTGGVCIPRCDPYAAMCPEGTACGVFTSHTPDALGQRPLCYRVGDVPLNGDCTDSVCAEGTCVRRAAGEAFACRAACDDANPCGDGFTCGFWDAPLDAYGFCYPEE